MHMGPIRGVVRAESGRSPPMSTGFDDGWRGVEPIEELLQTIILLLSIMMSSLTYLADRTVLPRLSELLADDSDATELALLPVGVDGGGSPACTGIDAHTCRLIYCTCERRCLAVSAR